MKRTTLAHCVIAALAGHAAAADTGPLSFDVNITLSPKAATELQKSKEGITVSARYYGDPTSAAARHANEVGQIDLGGEELRLPAQGGAARLTGRGAETYRLDWIQGPPKVNVNAFSSRLSHADNILSCDFIDGDVAQVVMAQPVELHCALITERRDPVLQPRSDVNPSLDTDLPRAVIQAAADLGTSKRQQVPTA